MTPEAGYSVDPTTAIQVLFGLKIALSAEVTAGTALVFSSAAVTCAGTPAAHCRRRSLLRARRRNVVRIAAELFAGVVVNAPANVAKVTKSP